jgi:hypothetical protein
MGLRIQFGLLLVSRRGVSSIFDKGSKSRIWSIAMLSLQQSELSASAKSIPEVINLVLGVSTLKEQTH